MRARRGRLGAAVAYPAESGYRSVSKRNRIVIAAGRHLANWQCQCWFNPRLAACDRGHRTQYRLYGAAVAHCGCNCALWIVWGVPCRTVEPFLIALPLRRFALAVLFILSSRLLLVATRLRKALMRTAIAGCLYGSPGFVQHPLSPPAWRITCSSLPGVQ